MSLKWSSAALLAIRDAAASIQSMSQNIDYKVTTFTEDYEATAQSTASNGI